MATGVSGLSAFESYRRRVDTRGARRYRVQSPIGDVSSYRLMAPVARVHDTRTASSRPTGTRWSSTVSRGPELNTLYRIDGVLALRPSMPTSQRAISPCSCGLWQPWLAEAAAESERVDKRLRVASEAQVHDAGVIVESTLMEPPGRVPVEAELLGGISSARIALGVVDQG